MNITEARLEVERQLDKHGLEGWKFEAMNGKRLLGQCRYRDKTIRISRWLCRLGTDAEVLDTILHEIAHALTPGHKHSWTWKAKAIELGAKPVACQGAMSYEVPHKYEILCGWCKTVIQKRHRRANLTRLASASHRACGEASRGLLTQRQVSW